MSTNVKYNNMTDFAAHFGLARSTVSYILNNKWKERNISPQTAKKVLDYAVEVGFAPNFLGLAINGKAHIDVAILLSHQLFEHHQHAFFKLLKQLEEKNLKFLVFQSGSVEENVVMLDRMRNFRVSCALLFAPIVLGTAEECACWLKLTTANPDIRFLFYDYRFDRHPSQEIWPKNVYLLGFRETDALATMLRFASRQGYRTIDNFFVINHSAVEELTPKFGMRCRNLVPSMSGVNSKIITRTLLENVSRDKPEAVLVPDDAIAATVIQNLLEAGLRVPEDYAFLSWDGLVLSPYFVRSLTTLVIPHEEMIQIAGDFFTGEVQSRCISVTPKLRIGDSLPERNGLDCPMDIP